MGKHNSTRCKFNIGVDCDDCSDAKCKICGWNPANQRNKPKKENDSTKLSKEIGHELHGLREGFGYTEAMVAFATNPRITAMRIADIENGTGVPISLSEFVNLCCALCISADRLLGWE